MASLEVGFSHDIFVEWAADGKSLVFSHKEAKYVFWFLSYSHPLKHFNLIIPRFIHRDSLICLANDYSACDD